MVFLGNHFNLSIDGYGVHVFITIPLFPSRCFGFFSCQKRTNVVQFAIPSIHHKSVVVVDHFLFPFLSLSFFRYPIICFPSAIRQPCLDFFFGLCRKSFVFNGLRHIFFWIFLVDTWDFWKNVFRSLVSRSPVSRSLVSRSPVSRSLVSRPLVSRSLVSRPLVSRPLVSRPLVSVITIYICNILLL